MALSKFLKLKNNDIVDLKCQKSFLLKSLEDYIEEDYLELKNL